MPKPVKPGEKVRIIANYSEVNMHMGIAGRPVVAAVEGEDYLHVRYYKDGKPWTTVTLGEGGFRQEDTPDGPVFFCDPDDGPGDADPGAIREEMTRKLREILDLANARIITDLGL